MIQLRQPGAERFRQDAGLMATGLVDPPPAFKLLRAEIFTCGRKLVWGLVGRF